MKGRYESEADTGNRIHCGMCNNEVEEGYTLIPDKATEGDYNSKTDRGVLTDIFGSDETNWFVCMNCLNKGENNFMHQCKEVYNIRISYDDFHGTEM